MRRARSERAASSWRARGERVAGMQWAANERRRPSRPISFLTERTQRHHPRSSPQSPKRSFLLRHGALAEHLHDTMPADAQLGAARHHRAGRRPARPQGCRPSEVAAWPSVVEGVCSLAQALAVARLVRMGRPDLRMIARAAAAAANDEEGASRFSAAAPPPGQLTFRADAGAGGEQRPHSAASAAETVVLVAGPPSLAAAASDFALAEGHTFHTERFEW